MTWLSNFLRSSVGRKQLMALTGLALAGFLIVHLSGNLLLFSGEQAFNGYAEFVTSQALLPVARIGLIAIFLLHIGLAIQLTVQNRAARGSRYHYKDASEATVASRTMIFSGMLTLIYVIIHLLDFTLADQSGAQGLYGLVIAKFTNPAYVSLYVVSMIILAAHLVHGIQSTFQSFGLNHAKHTPMLKKLLMLLAIVISAGFASIPIILMITKGGA